MRRYDKGGEQFYDTISALHKSVRGSDPDAALYWFVRMLDGGADPRYLARRLIRMATEDIGLADPRALRLALDAALSKHGVVPVEIKRTLGGDEKNVVKATHMFYWQLSREDRRRLDEAQAHLANFKKVDNEQFIAAKTGKDVVRGQSK